MLLPNKEAEGEQMKVARWIVSSHIPNPKDVHSKCFHTVNVRRDPSLPDSSLTSDP